MTGAQWGAGAADLARAWRDRSDVALLPDRSAFDAVQSTTRHAAGSVRWGVVRAIIERSYDENASCMPQLPKHIRKCH
jgi:hypothetical protein